MRSIACSSFLGQMLISHFYATRLVLQGEGRLQSRQGEVNPVWMLRFVQHDKSALIPHAFCHPEHLFVIPSGSEESTRGCFTALCLTITFRHTLPATPQGLAEKTFTPYRQVHFNASPS